MLKFLLAMILPLGIFIYTLSFGWWMQNKHQFQGALFAYLLALTSLGISGMMFWRMFT